MNTGTSFGYRRNYGKMLYSAAINMVIMWVDVRCTISFQMSLMQYTTSFQLGLSVPVN